jgi:glycosyltransferase involved in cell wall biosynthesis
MMKPMKTPEKLRILIMGNLAHYAIGGAEMQALRLSRHFAAHGHEVTVIGHANANATVDHNLYPGSITSVHLPTLRNSRLTRAITFFLALGAYLFRHRNRFDILLSVIIGESSLVAACLKRAGIIKQPLIVNSACAGSTGDAAGLKRLPATPLLVRLLNQTCDAVLILSPTIERELAAIGMDGRLFVPLGCGVPVLPLKPRPANQNHLPGFLFVGRFRPEKRVGDLLYAVHQLAQTHCFPQVHLVGDGPQRRPLETLARSLGIEQRIAFHGFATPDQLSDFYSGDTVLVVPSINEGLPIALLEAMAAGCPAIVTRNGGSEYLVDEHRGIVCPPCDSRAIAAAMLAMIEAGPEKRAAMGAEGRSFVLRHYEESSIGDRYLDLFRHLLPGVALDPKQFSDGNAAQNRSAPGC